MFKYAITQQETVRWSMGQVPAAQVTFNNPALTQFYADLQANLCTIRLQRHGPINTGTIRHELQISYHDPELELLRRLAV